MPWPRSTKTARIPKPNLYAADCPTRIILDDIMSRWGSLVIVLLRERTYRFSELAYLIGGVSEKMLAQTLRRLEMDGFVKRTVLATKPPKVEYSLTPLGRELSTHVHALTSFIHKRGPRILQNRDSARKKTTPPKSTQEASRKSPAPRWQTIP
ncbi:MULTISPECIES: helix-turn-helix domain-containing protein [Acidobacterium]|uniref:Putative transcriptional regulator n=1 Tax=Acidobacterium capsulatum (strain ATCC 51196 / DSM 11244 / BCRC 80197 / JCM 7670 / NBRC 15755 / NCIMB 13165 / 161) TaxID=240015 RepID=C1F689_ACIC5|nr:MULTISPECIES: helix-turn-helix domain-containing protein [Acidobacterium]ACO34509.1 putative transcriptional regulator [Acidobacterium capsulatum ATCC 51196]HCT61141.1 transcriptional regulator [Acidobacterium sp.]